jgi:hypothetical protein
MEEIKVVRRILILGMILAVVSFSVALAAEPIVMSFQGKLDGVSTHLDGAQTVLDGSISFKIYDVPTGGTHLWQEGHLDIVLDNGIFNLILGLDQSLDVIADDLADAIENGQSLYMGVTLSQTGQELTPRQRLTMAPLALVAKNLKGGVVDALSSNEDPAVYGKNDLGMGIQNPGVKGESSVGYGVYGLSTGSFGVHGRSTSAYGLFGYSTDSTAVYGKKDIGANDANPAIHGKNFRTTPGDNPGVMGESATGIGVKGLSNGGEEGGYFKSATGNAVFAETPNTSSGIAVWGRATGSGDGVRGNSSGDDAAGVRGVNSATSADANFPAPGVYGYSSKGIGVYGKSASSIGLRVEGKTGGAIIETDGGVGLDVVGVTKGINVSATTGFALYATSDNFHAVRGGTSHNESSGILGNNYADVFNSIYLNPGVRGWSKRGVGVYATSQYGHGIIGRAVLSTIPSLSKKYGGFFVGDGTQQVLGLGVKGHSYFDGNAWATGSFISNSTLSLDFAEWIKVSDAKVESGDVVVIDTNNAEKLKKASSPYSTLVAGIVSTSPAFLAGGMSEDDTDKIYTKEEMEAKGYRMLALVGQVPTKVSTENGPIKIGDLLTTSNTPGHAMKATDPKIGTIVGKALEALPSGKGKIKVLVTLQ